MLSFAEEMANAEKYLPAAPGARATAGFHRGQRGLQADVLMGSLDLQSKVDRVIAYLSSRGFVFEPWQVAAFITAVRTKPFIILAGISGTGKTKLPRLISEATGAECLIVPVRPDWSDSSELLGYERLSGPFQPGALLRFAQKAQNQPEKQFFLILV